MFFVFKVAWRYLFANIGQTLLLIAGVALGAIAFVYITTLMNGLRDRQIRLTTTNIAHIVLEPREKKPVPALQDTKEAKVLAAVQIDTGARPQIREWRGLVTTLENEPEVTAISPEINASGFIVRAQTVRSVSLIGLRPERLNAIIDFSDTLVDGTAQLDGASAIVGADLANDLGLGIGQTIRVRSDRQVEQLLTVRGIFKTGAGFADKRNVVINFDRARALAALPYGITDINVRVKDIWNATETARKLESITGLKAESWIESNPRLSDALNAQRRSGSIIQSFSMLTVIIGVASALLLSAYRRKAEIGIMRAMGLTKGFVLAVFVTQGALVGFIGACVGSFTGYKLTSYLATVGVRADGTPLLPIDPAQGSYGLLIGLITAGAILAALIPARMAARIDPVEAIGG